MFKELNNKSDAYRHTPGSNKYNLTALKTARINCTKSVGIVFSMLIKINSYDRER